MTSEYQKDIAVIFVAVAAFLAISWIGFYGGDDWEYFEAARQWLAKGWFLGDTHWEVRHTHVLSIAASFAIFGPGEIQLILPTVIYFLLTLLSVYYFLNRFISRKAALISCLLLTSTPIMIFITTMTRPGMTEAFFVVLSFVLFWIAPRGAMPGKMMLLAGIAAGLAWITRETTIALLIVYSIFFLAGWRISRPYYWIMAAGFIAVLICDAGYSTVMSGDPLYRYKTIISSHSAELSKNVDAQAPLLGVGEAVSSAPGNISVHWLIDPLAAILVNQEFGLLFWFAIPIGAWLCFSPGVNPLHREAARFLALLALVWFVMVSYGLGLREQPRYYAVPAIAAAALIGIGAANYAGTIPRPVVIALIALLISVNLLCFYIDNENPLYEERMAVKLAGELAEPIYTNTNSALMANRLLQVKQLSEVVSDAVPPAGGVYFYVPCKEEDLPCNTLKRQAIREGFDPEKQKANWTPIWHNDPGRKISGILIEKAGLKHLIPSSIYYKLDYPSQPVTAYRVSGERAGKPAATP